MSLWGVLGVGCVLGVGIAFGVIAVVQFYEFVAYRRGGGKR